jgi:flagellar biosynthesis regulator FlaF
MILDANQLASIRQRNDEELRRGCRATHGYPAHTVQDLLHTIEALKKEKRKWKKLAQDRGKTLKAISELASD